MTLLDRFCMITVLIGVLKPNFQIHILGQVRKDVFGAMLRSELYQAVQEMKSTVGFPWHWVKCEHIQTFYYWLRAYLNLDIDHGCMQWNLYVTTRTHNAYARMNFTCAGFNRYRKRNQFKLTKRMR